MEAKRGTGDSARQEDYNGDVAAEVEESEDDRRRRVAVDQADAVLESLGGDYYLDGFNLLGVIANPRGVTTPVTSYHGRYDSSGTTPTASHEDYYYSTLSQVTGQIEAFNHMLEDWSRQILEDDTYVNAAVSEELPESQLKELPEALRSLDLNPIQAYLDRTGKVAHSFAQILRHHRVEEHHHQQLIGGLASRQPLPDIPAIFFRDDFDLTDPHTFQKLLLETDESNKHNEESTSNSSGKTEVLINTSGKHDQPVAEWFPLPPQDACGGFLDKVELELLQQVRSKSSDFFKESVRFAQLQEWIQGLLQQVRSLQETTQMLHRDLLDPMTIVPQADQQRKDLNKLRYVVDQADSILQCKSSLAGVLSAQDDLLAIEQIGYGRRLLAGTTAADADGGVGTIELSRLHSLKAVAEQLNQFEELVVNKLRDELVEIFLGWNSSAVSNAYAVNGTRASSSQHVRERVREIFGALQSCHALEKTREAYNHRLLEMIRMTVRTTVAEFSSDGTDATPKTISGGTTNMSLSRFRDCLDLLFEQLIGLLTSATAVNSFCKESNFSFGDNVQTLSPTVEGHASEAGDSSDEQSGGRESGPLTSVIASGAELSSKSISELLRLRKEAHSLVTLDELKSIWDACLQFTVAIESMSGHSSNLRSALLAQAKAFVERKHESNMSALVAALDSERWSQCEVSTERQEALTRLCSGRSLISSSPKRASSSRGNDAQRNPEAEVEGTRYKVVWSCLLLVEMVITDVQAASYFSSLTSSIVGKISELLRLFNSRSTHLVLGAGAIHSNAKLKSINAKHLSLVTQCLGLVNSILPHIRAALMAHMPQKQHNLLNDLDQIRREYAEHNEKVLNKFVSIIGGIVDHGLAPKIAKTDFDVRAASVDAVTCCVFLEGVSSNIRKMHQVLKPLLPPDHLKDVFSRMFSCIDTRVPALFINASEKEEILFSFPTTNEGKKRLLKEVETMEKALNGLDGVLAWDFTAVSVLERRLDIQLIDPAENSHKAENSGTNPEDRHAQSENIVTDKANVGVELSDKTVGDKPEDQLHQSPRNFEEKAATTAIAPQHEHSNGASDPESHAALMTETKSSSGEETGNSTVTE